MADDVSPEEMEELASLADGTLPDASRARVEARVAGSPRLQELLERQRRAVLAAQRLADDEASESLRTVVEARRRALGSERARRRKLVPRIALAGATALAAAVAAILLVGGPEAPTVADAAALATQAPTGPAPSPAGSSQTRLGIGVDGVVFPDLARWAGWHAVGVRRGHVDGRDAVVVFYRKGGRRLAYVVVAGAGLPQPSRARTTVIRRKPYRVLRYNGRLAVTWRRDGHTCVLVGQASPAELIRLASWNLTLPR